jgi:type II secretory ATPase GspE/PulE/Tfp pilus assembly ATPase PilB-like protein
MSEAAHLELLSNVDIFANLEKKDLAALAAIAKVSKEKAGRVVFRQGDASDNFRVAVSGTFDCYLWDDLFKIERPITTFKRGDIFGEMGLLTDETRSAFVRAQTDVEMLCFDKAAVVALLDQHPKVAFNLARMLAHRLSAANKARGVKLDTIGAFDFKKEIAEMLPLQVILRHKVLPVARKDSVVTVAIVDPTDQVARNTVSEFLVKMHITWICVSQPDFENFRDKKLFDLVNASATTDWTAPSELRYLTSSSAPAVEGNSVSAQLLDDIIVDSIDAAASDLHFEPGPAGVSIRARIDGRLVELIPPITYAAFKPILSRIKVLSEMDITESRLPQDSVMRVKYGSRVVDFRVSTVPSPRAESVACRLFDPQQRKLDLANLIVSEAVATLVTKLFYLPTGLILVTGPTGSGKTTTLYAGIQARQKHNPTNKLVSAEDPIEYELNGATQIQVNPTIGLTFERILRSALRQDPDIILVGEIRDRSSMEIAIEASLTGHLVLSSLHTNDVFETMIRIRQRGIEPYAIASSLRGIISQRLVPRLCGACAEVFTPDNNLVAQLHSSGILDEGENVKTWQARGCTHCRMTGLKGRLGLYEVLVMTPTLRDAIENGATIAELQRAAPPGSYISMRRYAKFVMDKGLVNPKDVLEILPAAASAGEVK